VDSLRGNTARRHSIKALLLLTFNLSTSKFTPRVAHIICHIFVDVKERWFDIEAYPFDFACDVSGYDPVRR
jgi:hypothetical protein